MIEILHVVKPAEPSLFEKGIWLLPVLILVDGKQEEYDIAVPDKRLTDAIEKHFRNSVTPLTEEDLQKITDETLGEDYENEITMH